MSLAWGGHRNGQIPLADLALIPATNGQYIKRQLLGPLQALRAAFKARFGKSLDILEGYRDLTRQENLRYAWVHHYPGANLSAIPGASLHGWALSVDFGSRVNLYGSAEKKWMDANAPRYGFLPTGDGFRPREAWHFDGTGTVTASLSSTGIEDDMPTPAELWEFKMVNPATGKTDTAGNFLRYTVQAAEEIWAYKLAHPDTGKTDTAGNFLRYNGRTAELLQTLIAKPSTAIDVTKLAAALKAAGLTVTIDNAAIAKAVDASLSDNFAAIPAAVVSAAAAKLSK